MVISKTLFLFLLLAVLSVALPMHADGREYTHSLAVESRWSKGRNVNMTNMANSTALGLGSRPGACSKRPKLYRKAWYATSSAFND